MKQFSFRISPQQRLVPSSDKHLIPIVLPQSIMFLSIEELSILMFSGQAEQDINATLRIGGQKILWQSGLFTTTGNNNISEQPRHTSITRALSSTGCPYNALSSADSSGIPDNFDSIFSGTKYNVSGSEIVYFEIKNQSAIYAHPVRVNLCGLFYVEDKK